MTQKIIIDTDPGQDDALAILLALASPEVEVLGIVAAAGNVPLSLTSKNIRKICELAGRPDVRVFSGCKGPMEGSLFTAEYVHGATGMDGADLPEPTMPLQAQHGVEFIIETVMANAPGTVTICTLGPMTNLGTALAREPAIAGRIKQIVSMGGGLFEGGNVTPAAEFNIYVDPRAAEIVLGCGAPIVLMPLDVTHKTLTTSARVAAVKALGTRLSDAVVGWLEFFERFDEAKYGTDGGPLHDPNVIAYLIKPELYAGRLCNVEIETKSELTKGMTVADWWGVTQRPKNATFMRDVDADGFYALLTERLQRLPHEA
ncbi:nucleoside hydrolase [Rhizobium sp. 0TCS1.26]|uniref:nucleoside hydrolase n=1 Tax=Rhizobium sp. 0TCS1.26 TaxID=3142623 RepID=UPI003D2AA3E1